MDEWQGCLSPSCQVALINARKNVEHRGGYAITVEDFLLALLDTESRLLSHLKAHGVDHDELTRTIQCEQPIVSTLAGEGLLSSQLVYWFAMAREQVGEAWLDWPLLMDVLVHKADRLQGKAYVAVLEQVPRWHLNQEPGFGSSPIGSTPSSVPVVVTDSDWLMLAEDVAVSMMASPSAVFWLSGSRGAGKTTWLQSLIPLLQYGCITVDLRRESEVMASDATVMPVDQAEPPALILDNVSPRELLGFLADECHMARHIVLGFPGPLLMISAGDEQELGYAAELERQLGRPLECFVLPAANESQLLAVATAHQPRIEKRWKVELTLASIKYLASSMVALVSTPGQLLAVLERAAARVALFAQRGPLDSLRLAGELDSLKRQQLVALARQHEGVDLERPMKRLSLELAASEIGWHERKAAGHLRRVLVDDVVKELRVERSWGRA
ncbi:hypothetical protein [Marinobacter zhejiangensis]|uniref:Clp amino terminal domain-containing protein, pathogenicity island component n=1 Tax=Marinobacter zhejiangensis TaxID=488535 RepID=A0A1I4NLG2_9GAMM|nr:hypothetical protein [Marinobacter zhejiangensis]SFM16127.1 hypothetical protein SAMN04487963_1469 [Marinobacter zhejiangensis]